MAKSKGFFTLRRGSTKSLTFSVMNGQQITKDRVTSVANPKSEKQQYQRAIMATVMAAYSAMKAICDHSFEGKRKGSENQREFMSSNLNKLRSQLYVDMTEDNVGSQAKALVVGPKTPTALPYEWIISKGSLREQNIFNYHDDDHYFWLPSIASIVEGGSTTSYKITLGNLIDYVGIPAGLQVTFNCLTESSGIRIYEVDSQDYAGYTRFDFDYSRFVFKKSFEGLRNVEVSVPGGTAGKEIEAGLWQAAFAQLCDASHTTPWVLAGIQEITGHSAENPTAKVDAELFAKGFDESLTLAFGIISSIVDEDKRSTSSMIIRNNTAGFARGLTWPFILDAWKYNVNTIGESELYLEGGD